MFLRGWSAAGAAPGWIKGEVDMADQQDLEARIEALEAIIDALASAVSDADPAIERAFQHHLRVSAEVLRGDLEDPAAAAHVEAFAESFRHRA